MGTIYISKMADNSWAEGDLASTIMTVATAGGIYDFSGTVPEHVYANEGTTAPTKEEISSFSKCWWDGSAAGWSSDDDFNKLCTSGHKLVLNGTPYMIMRRNTFGDGDCQHIIQARKGKTGIIVGHADFTCVVGVFDEDKGRPAGPVQAAVQSLAESYKEQGY